MNNALFKYKFNNTKREFGNSMTIHQLFEEQVKKTPDSTALIFDEKYMSYLELNIKANKLAHYLKKLNAQKGELIAIHLNRSFEMVIAILAVMKIGGVYVAIDPNNPSSRIDKILTDTNTNYLITIKEMNSLDKFLGRRIFMDEEAELINSEEGHNMECVSELNDPINIVYTSASTGSPKGTIILMRAVANRLFWMWDEYPFNKDDVVVLQKSYSVVAATWELFGGLLKGIPTLILKREDILSASVLWEKLKRFKVSYLLASPAFLRSVIDQAKLHIGEWTTLRLATTSAEPITVSMVKEWYKVFPNVPLLNLYGSTECSSNAAQFDTRNLSENAKIVPIGKPLSNIKMYILDKNQQPVEKGEVGELCISGACLAKGYLKLPDITSKKFITNPFSHEDGHSVLYRTGDLAKVLSDGNIVLVGREDNLVKLRGYRIQLEEVEEALSKVVEIKRAIVSLEKKQNYDNQLVAYLLLKSNSNKPKIHEMYSMLNKVLPNYMIPSKYYIIDRFPLNANGKIDRAALSKLKNCMELQIAKEYIEPKNEIEKKLCDLICKRLGIDEISTNYNFFELGISSIDITQLNMQLQQIYKADISIVRMFQYPTVKQLAEYIDGIIQNKENSLLQNINVNVNKSKQRMRQTLRSRRKIQ